MALSIKNVETERLARELARATGQTVTRAVTGALTAQLEALRDSDDVREGRWERVRTVAADAAARWGADDRVDPAADLYDDGGLPR
ncbi:type II toxin-antitoxin system VapB family antitoxin [Pseudokineococcus basanitobsidens]|uniref:Type II toxin-antitoxin system VapB family antitoxin n=1 Tax=Pseudokineococcus basanitobsidens TaxID=1926649 RepID=A0ABU8RF39_9ACTN